MSSIGNKEIFARNLKYYLELHGKSQKEIADYLQVNPSSVNDWVKAKKYPRIDKIELLSIYFGILKSDLIEEKGSIKTLSSVDIQLFGGNVPQSPAITEDEELLLTLFRQIPEDQQVMVLNMIRAALNRKE